MSEEAKVKLRELIKDMDVPNKRKEINDMSDLWWLQRNLGISKANRNHRNYKEAMNMIKARYNV